MAFGNLNMRSDISLYLGSIILIISMLTKIIGRSEFSGHNKDIYVNDIREISLSILDKYESDRVVIYLFDDYTPNSKSPIKFKVLNCYNEVTNLGIENRCYQHQNIPTTLISNIFRVIGGRDTFYKHKITNKTNPTIKYLFNLLAVRSLYTAFIRNEKDEMMGMISMQSVNKEVMLGDVKYFENSVEKIESLLNK